MSTTITSKGQVTIPKIIREMLHLCAGDKVEFVVDEKNEVSIKPVTKKTNDVYGQLSQYKKSNAVDAETMDHAIKERFKKKYNEST